MKTYDTAVVVGRFQIPHKAHIDLLHYASKVADTVLVVMGSVNSPRTIKNPFDFTERSSMLKHAYNEWRDDSVGGTLKIRGIVDRKYNDTQWFTHMRKIINSSANGKTVLVGHHKDESSFYLDKFPEFDFLEFSNVTDLNSTDIRNSYFGEGVILDEVPTVTHTFLSNFMKTEEYKILVDEYNFIERYKTQWSVAPYPVTFNTVDAVVICAGHILLVERGAAPGKGLWALPGGFVDVGERLEESVFRELLEETKIKVSKGMLKDKIKSAKREIFDDPNRSLRGRTISVAYLIEFFDNNLPQVKGSDDAAKAFWVPLNKIEDSRSMLFEDHYDIINTMTGGF